MYVAMSRAIISGSNYVLMVVGHSICNYFFVKISIQSHMHGYALMYNVIWLYVYYNFVLLYVL